MPSSPAKSSTKGGNKAAQQRELGDRLSQPIVRRQRGSGVTQTGMRQNDAAANAASMEVRPVTAPQNAAFASSFKGSAAGALA